MDDYSESSEIIDDDNAGNIKHKTTFNSNRLLFLSQVNDRIFYHIRTKTNDFSDVLIIFNKFKIKDKILRFNNISDIKSQTNNLSTNQLDEIIRELLIDENQVHEENEIESIKNILPADISFEELKNSTSDFAN